MEEKITLIGPDGVSVEKKLVCAFKSVDDSRPNIKNIPIVILDTEQLNNGNNVLSFYWEKDGLYQPIIDEATWGETKLAVIDIIKNNTNTVEPINLKEIKISAGQERLMAVNSNQLAGLAILKTMVAAPVVNEQTEVNTPEVNPSISSENEVSNDASLVNNVVAETIQPEVNNQINEVATQTPEIVSPVTEQVISPVVNVVPQQSAVNVEQPVLNPNAEQAVSPDEISNVASNPVVDLPTTLENPVVNNMAETSTIQTEINQPSVVNEPVVSTQIPAPTAEPEINDNDDIVKIEDINRRRREEIDAINQKYDTEIINLLNSKKKIMNEPVKNVVNMPQNEVINANIADAQPIPGMFGENPNNYIVDNTGGVAPANTEEAVLTLTKAA